MVAIKKLPQIPLPIDNEYQATQETADILQAFQPEYIMVTYHDPLLNDYRTAEFYVGDRSAPVKYWLVDKKYYE